VTEVVPGVGARVLDLFADDGFFASNSTRATRAELPEKRPK